MSKFIGESEQGVRELFAKARQAAPCIIFLDEVDALIPARGESGTDSHVAERVLSQFLAEMDGLEELKGVFVLGATNRVDLIDPAMLRPGRFDDVIHIPLPSQSAREEILKIHLRNKPLKHDVDIQLLASRCAGASGAELAAICNRAALSALRRNVEVSQAGPEEKHPIEVTPEDLESALLEVIQVRE